MTSTSFLDFNAKTKSSTVAKAFSSQIKNRTFFITGVNKKGIGYATARALAEHSPRFLIIAGRSDIKLKECLDSLRQDSPDVDIRHLLLDLSSQKSVREAATKVLGWDDMPTIDVVINNAGIMNVPEHTLSEDGIELHMAINHIGHFLFTNLITEKITKTIEGARAGSTRIINVSSMAAIVSPLRSQDVNWEKPISELPQNEKPNINIMNASGLNVDESMTYVPMGAYAQSKTANILFSVGLNARLYDKYGVLSIAVHPGEARTELHRTTDWEWMDKTVEWKKKMNMEWKTVEEAASTTLVAALDPKLGRPEEKGYGQFLSDCQITMKVPPFALNSKEAYRLWGMSEDWVQEKYLW
jgi:NAD(P)-dependent dehydrogenase (short-subunit alcohol dehydrogenase family)